MILLHELFNGLVTFFKCTLQEIRLNEIKISGNVSFLHPMELACINLQVHGKIVDRAD